MISHDARNGGRWSAIFRRVSPVSGSSPAPGVRLVDPLVYDGLRGSVDGLDRLLFGVGEGGADADVDAVDVRDNAVHGAPYTHEQEDGW